MGDMKTGHCRKIKLLVQGGASIVTVAGISTA